MKIAVLIIAAVALTAWTPLALADEVVRTHAGEAPAAEAASAASDQDQPQTNGDWARRVLDRAANPEQAKADDKKAADQKACQRNPDRQPHGEVWAGVGTGGYHTAGAVVTQPIGDCGQATVAISQTDNGRSRGRRH